MKNFYEIVRDMAIKDPAIDNCIYGEYEGMCIRCHGCGESEEAWKEYVKELNSKKDVNPVIENDSPCSVGCRKKLSTLPETREMEEVYRE